MAKKVVKPEQHQNPVNNFSAEKIDMNKPEYTNCAIYTIQNAYFGQHPFLNQQNLVNVQKQNVEEKEDEKNEEIIRKKMTDYIASVTGFSPEMVERVIDCAEQFMRDNFTDDLI